MGRIFQSNDRPVADQTIRRGQTQDPVVMQGEENRRKTAQ